MEPDDNDDNDVAGSCRHLLDLPADATSRVLALVGDGISLAQTSACCRALRAQVTNELWREVVLQAWGWLLGIRLGAACDWRLLYVRLHTGQSSLRSDDTVVRFCVVGTCVELGIHQSSAHEFDPSQKVWRAMPAPTALRDMPAVVRSLAGELIVIGGISAQYSEHGIPTVMQTLASVESFADGAWTARAPMRTARCCCSAALDINGSIFVVGGGASMYRGAACLRSVERLDTGSGVWVEAPEMESTRCAVGVASSFEHNRLFAFGGYSGALAYLDTAEALDMSAGADARWVQLPPMTCKRAGCNAACGPDGRVYVLGGGPDGQRQWNTMEILDPRTDTWQLSSAKLRWGRHYNASAFGPDGYLYASGTFRHSGQLDVVERYDPRVDKWETLPKIGTTVHFSAGAFLF